MIAPEYLLNNFIEKELQEVLTPLTITDRLIISMKFRIKDSFITSNSKLYILMSFIATCAFVSFHLFRAFFFEIYRYNLIAFSILVFVNIGSMIVEFIINFGCVLNSDKYVKILLKIQEIDRNLEILDHKRFTRYKFLAWIMVAFLVICQFFTAFTNTYFFQEYSFIQFYVTMSRFFFDVNIIYVIIIMDFLTSRLNIWSSKVDNISKQEHNDKENWRERTAILLDTYKSVLKILKWVQKVFALPILFYAVELFLLSLIYVEAMLLVRQYKFHVPESTATITLGHYFSWVVKIFVLIITLSAKTEMFYTAHKRAKSVCLGLLMRNHENADARRMSKNVLRAGAVRYGRLSACGVFTVDATLPLELISLVATYTVVLLQFAFL